MLATILDEKSVYLIIQISAPEMEVGSGFSGRVRVGPGFGPQFLKRNRAQSRAHWLIIFFRSDVFLKANNFFSFGHISQNLTSPETVEAIELLNSAYN